MIILMMMNHIERTEIPFRFHLKIYIHSGINKAWWKKTYNEAKIWPFIQFDDDDHYIIKCQSNRCEKTFIHSSIHRYNKIISCVEI